MERSSSVEPAKDRQAEIRHILAILHKWGIHTLGQFAALDREQLGARLGWEAARLWERANGRSGRLLKFVQPPESFADSFEFENEIETAEPLLFMLRRFLQQLSFRLSAIYLVTKELTLRITFANPPQVRLFQFSKNSPQSSGVSNVCVRDNAKPSAKPSIFSKPSSTAPLTAAFFRLVAQIWSNAILRTEGLKFFA